MKFASYEVGGVPGYGAVIGDRIVDLTQSHLGATLKDFLASSGGESVAEAASAVIAEEPEGRHVSELSFEPVIPAPTKILCVGINYKTHRDETKRPEIDFPTIFTRFADSQIGPGRAVRIPDATKRFDYEGELAVVIGRNCRDVAESDALSVVAGYSCYNDFSARDWQRHSSQWVPGKNFPGTGGFGPWLVTSDEVPDPGQLHLTTRVNGEERQSAAVRDMLFPVPRLISYISTFTPLVAGDVIVTGTPGGVGQFMDPPTFLRPGDTVEVEISGLGVLRNRII